MPEEMQVAGHTLIGVISCLFSNHYAKTPFDGNWDRSFARPKFGPFPLGDDSRTSPQYLAQPLAKDELFALSQRLQSISG
jgi:hypothetical protein